jgi:DNA primase
MTPIPEEFVAELCKEADLSLLVAERQHLRHSGNNLIGRCRFCGVEEFTINERKRFYHCFSCGRSGTALTYLIEADDLSFSDAVKLLAEMQGFSHSTKNL